MKSAEGPFFARQAVCRIGTVGFTANGRSLAPVLQGGWSEMAKGTVKWFNSAKGYGFIQPDDGEQDVFVHITAVQEAGLTGLEDNQKIEYELIDGRDGRKSAGDLKIS